MRCFQSRSGSKSCCPVASTRTARGWIANRWWRLLYSGTATAYAILDSLEMNVCMYVCMQRIHTLILLYRNNSIYNREELIDGRIHTHIPLNDPIFFNLFLCINKSLSIGSSKFSITEMSWSHIHKLVRVIATGERFETRWIPLFKTAEAINIKVFKLRNVCMYVYM